MLVPLFEAVFFVFQAIIPKIRDISRRILREFCWETVSQDIRDVPGPEVIHIRDVQEIDRLEGSVLVGSLEIV